MMQWRDHSRELALNEMLRLEGQGGYAGSPCGECSTPDPVHRCTDCFGDELFCKQCTLLMHRHSPFHVIEVSNSPIFISCSIETLQHISGGMECSSSDFL
jgi:hypothetical protein